MTYAIIKTGGKQYKIKKGDILKIEKIEANEGSKIDFKEILMIFDQTGKTLKIGTPFVKGAKVSAKVLEQGKGKKITVVKYKPKIRYKRKYGHRQAFTKVEIIEVK